MIWRKLFPREGGGALRRWIKVNKALIEKSRDSEHILKGPISLFDFGDADDAADAAMINSSPIIGGWRISDDEVIGGFSRGNLTIIRSSEELQRCLRGEDDPLVLKGGGEERNTSDDFTPFLRWNGTIDTSIGEMSKVQRSGFCAIRSPEFPFGGANLSHKYNALEITCRTDGRLYTVNLTVSTYFPDDLYQDVIDEGPTHPPGSYICSRTGGKFSRVILPFQRFVLTAGGRAREVQRKLDGGVRIETVGITLMDGQDDDFEFDLARIRAVNYFDGQVLGEDDEDSPY